MGRINPRLENPDTPVGYKGYAGDCCANCGWVQQALQTDHDAPHVVWSEVFQQQLCAVCFRKAVTVYTRMADKQRSNNFYSCDGCGHYHRDDYYGDCRTNSERYTDVPLGSYEVDAYERTKQWNT